MAKPFAELPTQLNVRLSVGLKRSLKEEAKQTGVKLEEYVASILEARKPVKAPAKPKAAATVSPFDKKKKAREKWDRDFKKIPPEMQDAWKEENPRP